MNHMKAVDGFINLAIANHPTQTTNGRDKIEKKFRSMLVNNEKPLTMDKIKDLFGG